MIKVKSDKQSLPSDGKVKGKSLETEQLRGQLARALADYDNLRKRTDEEKTLWIKFSSQSIITKLLTILDMLEKAQEHLKDQGLAIATLEFKKILNEEGVTEIQPKVGESFDHELHEAIETVEDGEKGTIAETVVPGWRYNDLPVGRQGGQVLRYAKVKVYN